MPATMPGPDYEFVVRTPDRAIEYVIGKFNIPIAFTISDDGEPGTIVANQMLAEAIHEAARAVQELCDDDPEMTRIDVC